jgi:hypothetical protein
MPRSPREWADDAEVWLVGASAKHWRESPEQAQLEILYSIACSLLGLLATQVDIRPGVKRAGREGTGA